VESHPKREEGNKKNRKIKEKVEMETLTDFVAVSGV
jgi:hypothetical protein